MTSKTEQDCLEAANIFRVDQDNTISGQSVSSSSRESKEVSLSRYAEKDIEQNQEDFKFDEFQFADLNTNVPFPKISKTSDCLNVDNMSADACDLSHWWEKSVKPGDALEGHCENDRKFPVHNVSTENTAGTCLDIMIKDSEIQIDSMKSTGCTGGDIRRKRRREFHKIHTRRSRAKLNEKMELLKSMLPSPPPGMVVKSKAQIIEHTILILKQIYSNKPEQLFDELPE